MDYKKIIDNFQKKIYAPIYLLMGENPYLIDKITHFIEDNFFEDESLKDFNMEILYGKDSNVPHIVSLAKQFPMMSNYRLLIIKEAKDLKKITDLLAYAQKPQKQTVLVLCYKYGRLDKRTTLYKAIEKIGCVFDSPKVYDNQVSKYVLEMVAEKKFTIDNYTAELIANHIGTDLARINNELDKFKNIILQGNSITPDLVQEYIGVSKEFNDFELVNAIFERNIHKAFTIIHFFQSNPQNNPIQRTIGVFYSSFMKLLQFHFSSTKSNLKQFNIYTREAENSFRQGIRNFPYYHLTQVVYLLKTYDLKSKGFEGCNTPGSELLKELIFRIIEQKYDV